MTAQSAPVLIESHGHVRLITLNSPQTLNAMSAELQDALHGALAEADLDDGVRAIVITGAGRAFCAGADIGSTGPENETPEAILSRWWDADYSTTKKLLSIMEMNTPVIAAVNGWVLGKGFWYALAADITIAADDAVFGQPEVRHISQSSYLFAALVGWKHAHRYALTGDHFDAAEALRIGAINEIVPKAELLEHALRLAQRIALVPPVSVRINKAIINRGLLVSGLLNGMMMNGALAPIAHASARSESMASLDDIRRSEGLSAFLKARDDAFRPEPGGPRAGS